MLGHSMAETLTVALRVAEEAIEEAIAKAEEFSDSLVRRPSAPFLPSSLCLPLFHLLFIPLFSLPAFSVLASYLSPLLLSSRLPLGLSISGMQSWFLAKTSAQTSW